MNCLFIFYCYKQQNFFPLIFKFFKLHSLKENSLAILIPWNKPQEYYPPHAQRGEQNELSMPLKVSPLQNHIDGNSSIKHILKTKDVSGRSTDSNKYIRKHDSRKPSRINCDTVKVG